MIGPIVFRWDQRWSAGKSGLPTKWGVGNDSHCTRMLLLMLNVAETCRPIMIWMLMLSVATSTIMMLSLMFAMIRMVLWSSILTCSNVINSQDHQDRVATMSLAYDQRWLLIAVAVSSSLQKVGRSWAHGVDSKAFEEHAQDCGICSIRTWNAPRPTEVCVCVNICI